MAGKEFKSISAALAYLETHVVISLERIGEELKGVLRNNVRLLWYERDYTPTHYTRTYELIDSITVSKAKKVGNGYEVMIYFDTDKINPYPASDGEWSKHQSITTGTDVSVYIPLWADQGQNSPLFSYEGVGFMKETIDWIKEDEYLKNRMIELLVMKGFNVLNKLEGF